MQICLFIYMSLCSNALIQEFKAWVESQFENKQSIEWIRVFQGNMDGSMPLLMVLGNDGKVVKGIYQYKNCSERFTLEGQWSQNQVQLIEWDQRDYQSGYMIFKPDDLDIRGTWMNFDKNLILDINLQLLNEIDLWEWPTGDSWVRHYYGQFSGQRVELLLQKEKSIYNGVLYGAENKKSFFVSGQCSSLPCTKIELQVDTEDGLAVASMQAQFIKDQVINITYSALQKPTAFYSLSQKREIQISSKTEISYSNVNDFAVPSFEDLEEITSTFYDSHIREDSNETIDPGARLSNRRYGWQTVHWLNSRVYSASIFYYDNETDSTRTFLINYDLKRKEAISIAALFKKKSNYMGIFENFIEARLANSSDENLSKLSPKDFKHIGFLKSGFLIATDFNAIDGQIKWIVPYNRFYGQYAKGTVMEHFYKYK